MISKKEQEFNNLDYIMVVLGQLPSTNLHKASIMTLKYIYIYHTPCDCFQPNVISLHPRLAGEVRTQNPLKFRLGASGVVFSSTSSSKRKVRTEGPKGKRNLGNESYSW